MRNVLSAAAIGITLVSVAACTQGATSGEHSASEAASILDAAGKALGVAQLNDVQSWHYRATLADNGLTGTMEGWIDRAQGAEATHVHLPPLSRNSGYDGSKAWSKDATGIVTIDGSVGGRTAALNKLYRDTYAAWTPDRGNAHIESAGQRTDGGATYDVVRITPTGSAAPFEYWFDSVTHLPVRVVEVIGPITTKMELGDYKRTAAGFQFPYTQKTSDSQGNGATVTVDGVDINPSEMATYLHVPASTAHDYSLLSGTSTTIPFQLIDNHIFINMMINGKGPYRFIFDTGVGNVIDPVVAKEVGATGVGSTQEGKGVGSSTVKFGFARVDSLRVGNAQVRGQLFRVVPVREGLAMSSSEPFDGLIGAEVLSRFVTTFDYPNNRVTLRMPSSEPLPGKPVHIAFGRSTPEAACKINGIETVCMIDTGSRNAVDLFSPFIAAHPGVVPATATAPGVDGYGFGGPATARMGRISSLEIGGHELHNVITGFSTATTGALAQIGLGGLVGSGVFKRFSVTFDYPRQLMSMEPSARADTSQNFDRSGIFAIRQKDNLVVVGVFPGTAAADAGIKTGDVIMSINGKSGSALTLGSLRAAFRMPAGTTLHVGVISSSSTAPRYVDMTLRDYV